MNWTSPPTKAVSTVVARPIQRGPLGVLTGLCSGVRRILLPSSRLSLMALRSPMRAPWSPEWTRRRTACLVALRDAGRRNRAVSLLRPAVNSARPSLVAA
jgi:hypothetical protein